MDFLQSIGKRAADYIREAYSANPRLFWLSLLTATGALVGLIALSIVTHGSIAIVPTAAAVAKAALLHTAVLTSTSTVLLPSLLGGLYSLAGLGFLYKVYIDEKNERKFAAEELELKPKNEQILRSMKGNPAEKDLNAAIARLYADPDKYNYVTRAKINKMMDGLYSILEVEKPDGLHNQKIEAAIRDLRRYADKIDKFPNNYILPSALERHNAEAMPGGSRESVQGDLAVPSPKPQEDFLANLTYWQRVRNYSRQQFLESPIIDKILSLGLIGGGVAMLVGGAIAANPYTIAIGALFVANLAVMGSFQLLLLYAQHNDEKNRTSPELKIPRIKPKINSPANTDKPNPKRPSNAELVAKINDLTEILRTTSDYSLQTELMISRLINDVKKVDPSDPKSNKLLAKTSNILQSLVYKIGKYPENYLRGGVANNAFKQTPRPDVREPSYFVRKLMALSFALNRSPMAYSVQTEAPPSLSETRSTEYWESNTGSDNTAAPMPLAAMMPTKSPKVLEDKGSKAEGHGFFDRFKNSKFQEQSSKSKFDATSEIHARNPAAGLAENAIEHVGHFLRTALAATHQIIEDAEKKLIEIIDPETNTTGATIQQADDTFKITSTKHVFVKPSLESLPKDMNAFTVECSNYKEAADIRKDILRRFGNDVSIDFSANADARIQKLSHNLQDQSSAKPHKGRFL